MENDITPIGVFVASFAVAAFSGLAALLRSGVKLSLLAVSSAILNSGLLGLGISLLWYVHFRDNLYFLIGVCLISGLGGMTTIDFVLAAIRKGGFAIKLGKDNEGER